VRRATGSIAGQIAKVKGSRVVGIAGGPDKCAWLRDTDGIDVLFDKVGGEILDAALLHIAMHARVVLCGAISQYDVDDQSSRYGIKNLNMLTIHRGSSPAQTSASRSSRSPTHPFRSEPAASRRPCSPYRARITAVGTSDSGACRATSSGLG